MSDDDPSQRGRARFSTQVDPEIQSLARAAVRGVQRASGTDYSLAQLTEDALAAWIDHLAELYNNGDPWPGNSRALRPGRRLGD